MKNSIIDGVDYGPLAGLAGTWEGSKGMDVAPDPEMPREENPYFETIEFEPVGTAKNADKQVLAALFYVQKVYRKSDRKMFHHQCGYWTWDASTGAVTQSLAIPRAVTVLSTGTAKDRGEAIQIEVQSGASVAESTFMRDNASTTSFRISLTLEGKRLKYSQTTMVAIYGKSFEHTDTNELERIG